MQTFLTWGEKKIMLLFLSEKNQNLLDIQEHGICKLGKIQSELKLLFGVYYWFLKLYTGIIWHSYFPLDGIPSKRAEAGLGPSGLNLFTFLPCILSEILSFKLQNILCKSPKLNYCQDSPEVWSILGACLIPQLCNFVAISFCPKCKRLGLDTVPSSNIQANEAWITLQHFFFFFFFFNTQREEKSIHF